MNFFVGFLVFSGSIWFVLQIITDLIGSSCPLKIILQANITLWLVTYRIKNAGVFSLKPTTGLF